MSLQSLPNICIHNSPKNSGTVLKTEVKSLDNLSKITKNRKYS